jgi:hypothetical protein
LSFEPQDIFRREALDYEAAYRARGAVLLWTLTWGRLAWAIVGGAVVVAGLFLLLVRLPQPTRAMAVVRGGRVLARVPAAQCAHLRPDMRARVRFRGFPEAGAWKLGSSAIACADGAPCEVAVVPCDATAAAVVLVDGMEAIVELATPPVRLWEQR